jgi:hypothetical protein
MSLFTHERIGLQSQFSRRLLEKFGDHHQKYNFYILLTHTKK